MSQRIVIDQIMLRGAAIFGCELPASEKFAEIISEEIKSFILKFGFGSLTEEEFLLALRLNTHIGLKWPSGEEVEPISFKGTYINVDFLSSVLTRYFSFRIQLDRKFENAIDGYDKL